MLRVPRPSHRGSVYILVLGSAMLVTVIGVSSLLLTRVQHRVASNADDMVEARLHAWAAVNLGLQLIDQDSSWRGTYGNTSWPKNQPIGDGTYTIEVTDPADADLVAGPPGPVILSGIGMMNQARHEIQVTLAPPPGITPLEVLATAIHADGNFTVFPATPPTTIFVSAPISSNANVVNDGDILGDVEAAGTVTNNGLISGLTTFPVPVKEMPLSGVFETYRTLATQLPYAGDIDRHVLAPGFNSYGGGLNRDGVYFIDTGGLDLVIRASRIHGTLVVRCGPTATVIVDKAALLHSYRSDYPVLIVDGMLDIRLDSGLNDLVELIWGTNFNPVGAPYLSTSDNDHKDNYPNEIQGLIHATRRIRLWNTSLVRGLVLGEQVIEAAGDILIFYDSNLYTTPPLGYTSVDSSQPVQIVAGTWVQGVN